MFHAGACCVFRTFFSTHRHPASTSPAHPVSVPIRHPSDKSSAVTSFETDIYLHRKCNKNQAHTRYTHACGVWVLFLEHGGEALGIFKSPVCTYNQAWTFSLSASHYFSFLSKRSGRHMPPAERSALHIIYQVYVVQRQKQYMYAPLLPAACTYTTAVHT